MGNRFSRRSESYDRRGSRQIVQRPHNSADSRINRYDDYREVDIQICILAKKAKIKKDGTTIIVREHVVS